MSETQFISAADPRLQWMGRTHVAGGSMKLGFPGVSLLMNVRSPSAEMNLIASSPDCSLDVSIDDGEFKKIELAAGESRIVLAENLSTDRDHVLRIVRRNESWEGVLEIRGITIPISAKFLDPPTLPDRKILFIGDSITVGSANECLPPDYVKAPRGTNANRSFGMELGRRLNAQMHLVAFGGRGLIRDWLGNDNTKTNNAPIFFERSLPDDAAAIWDHNKFSPQVVVVGLGANDFSVGIAEESVWVSAYDDFLKRIREVHPAARLILTSSPDFSDQKENGDFAKAAALDHYLDETIKKSHERGDADIEKIALRHQPGTEVDSHPTVQQHLLIADDLEPTLRRILDRGRLQKGRQ